jgi:hypothetical protein
MTSLLIIILAATSSSCVDAGNPLGPVDPQATVRISPENLSLRDGDTAYFTATVYDKKGHVLDPLPAGMRVVWSSDNPQIASVSGEGLVRALRPGQARVKAEFASSNAWAGVAVQAVPSEMVAVGGDTLDGIAGGMIEEGLVVRVLDHRGEPVSGVDVSFDVTSGGGTVSPSVVPTGVSGSAKATWTLGPKVGVNEVLASATGLEPITLTAIGAPDLENAVLEVISGDGQEGIVGETLAAPLVVRMVDEHRNPVVGAVVRWAFSLENYHGGPMPPLVSITDPEGYSRIYWTLGDAAGTQTAMARRWGGDDVKEWNANAKAGKVRRVAVTPSASQIEVGSEIALKGEPKDRFGNLVEGASVFWDSSREDVAPVDQRGRVHGAGPGEATISAFAGDAVGAATVSVLSGTLERVVLTPRDVTLDAGGTQQFSASGIMDDGSLVPIDAVFSATGGAIDAGGLYTAGPAAGAFLAVALHEASGHADTASVTIHADAPALAAPPGLTLELGSVIPSSGAIEILAFWGAVDGADQYGWRFQAQDDLVSPHSGESAEVTVTVMAAQADADYLATVCVWAKSGALSGPESCGEIPVPALEAGPPVLSRIVISPEQVSLNSGEVAHFTTHGELTDGSTASVTVTFTATGGSITEFGLYTAGAASGTFEVVATEPASGLSDTAQVHITALPSWADVVITPTSAVLTPGSSAQFTASGRAADGSMLPVAATFAATGGTITAGGLYTAGSLPGSYRVIATEATTGDADTAQITIQIPPPPGDRVIAANDWEGISTEDLPGLRIFWNNRNGVQTFELPVEYGNVAIVDDPEGHFGQVVRIRQNPDELGIFRTPQGTVVLDRPYKHVWYRLHMRMEPGWRSNHSDPNAGSYKYMFLRGHLRIQGDDGTGQTYGVPTHFGYGPGNRTDGSEGSWNLGSRTTEWDDGQWQELVLYADLTQVPARFGAWRRTVVKDGVYAPGPWKHLVFEFDRAYDGEGVQEVWMGANFNDALDFQQWLYWGPWEVVDGDADPDPFGLAHYLDLVR